MSGQLQQSTSVSPPTQAPVVEAPAPAPEAPVRERPVGAIQNSGTPLDEYKAYVDATADVGDLLSATAEIARAGQAAAVRADNALMEKLANKLPADDMAMATLFLQGEAAWAVRQVVRAGGLTAVGWNRIVANADSAQTADVIRTRATFDAVKALNGDPLGLFPPVRRDPAVISDLLSSCRYFVTFIIQRGGIPRLTEIRKYVGGYEAMCELRADLVRTGAWAGYVNGLAPATRGGEENRDLWFLFLASEGSLEDQKKLFNARFGVSIEVTGGHEWDHTSLKRVWELCDALPAGDVADTLRIVREGSTGEASGWADGNQNVMEWGTDRIGATEIGAYTEDGDAMRGLNIFNGTFRHEMGHNVGPKGGFDQPGGFVYTVFGWDKHVTDGKMRDMINAALAVHPLQLNYYSDAVRDQRRDEIIDQIVAVGTSGGVTPPAIENAVDQVDSADPSEWTSTELERNEPFYRWITERSRLFAWDRMSDIGGRSYHVSYPFEGFVSCPVARYGNKVSKYAMRSPEEWFAEIYATFYSEADTATSGVGTLLDSVDPTAADRMRSEVHGRHDLARETGQTTGTIGA